MYVLRYSGLVIPILYTEIFQFLFVTCSACLLPLMWAQTMSSCWMTSSTLVLNKGGQLDRFNDISFPPLFNFLWCTRELKVLFSSEWFIVHLILGICWTSRGVHDCSEAELWGESPCTGKLFNCNMLFCKLLTFWVLRTSIWPSNNITVWRFCKSQCIWATDKIQPNASRLQWWHSGKKIVKITYFFKNPCYLHWKLSYHKLSHYCRVQHLWC